MDEDAYQRLSRIRDELMQLCRWVNDERGTATASKLNPIVETWGRLVEINQP